MKFESTVADGGRNYTRKELCYRIRAFLAHQPGMDDLRFEPSRLRPKVVAATVATPRFLGRERSPERATFEVEWRPRPGDRDGFRIQWIESGPGRSVGWHQDATHPDLGACHFQVDAADGTTRREPASFDYDHPLGILSECLAALPTVLGELDS